VSVGSAPRCTTTAQNLGVEGREAYMPIKSRVKNLRSRWACWTWRE